MNTPLILLSLLACSDTPADPADDTADEVSDDTSSDTDSDTADTEPDTSEEPGNPDLPMADCTLLAEHDNDGNGTADVAYQYVYDSQERLIGYDLDSGANGTADIRYEYTYGDDGALLVYTRDEGLDGIDYTAAYTRDDDGDTVRIEVDTDGSGEVDQVVEYTYDEDKRLLSEAVDSDMDSIADDLHTHQWTDNGDSTWTDQRITDYDRDGVADVVTETIYDAEERRSDYWLDSDADGIWDQRQEYTYNDAGTVDVWQVAFLDDAGVEVDTSYTWEFARDAWGRTDYADVHTQSVSLNLDFWAVSEYTWSCQ